MKTLLTRIGPILLLAPGALAQSIYLDFGDPASAYGVPPATYGGAGPPGTWQGVSTQVTNALIDVTGAATGASLTMSDFPQLDECGSGATTGADEALYDDRCYFDHVFVTLDFAGLQPGVYVVNVHLVLGACVGMFQPLTVEIDDAVPASDDAFGGWTGAPQEGMSYSSQLVAVDGSGALEVHVWAQSGFANYTQVCGVQLRRFDAFQTGCPGDGSGTACPCGNTGTANSGCANSTGVGGRLVASGTSSVAVDDLRFTGHDLPPGKPSLLFAGTNSIAGGAGIVFGDGVRCVGGSVVRLGVKNANANGLAFWGPGLAPAGGWNPGDTRHFQVWYRDPLGPCGSTFNITSSVRALFVP